MQTHHFRYRGILEILDRFAVEHIVVGGVCAVAHGAPITTFDLDLVHRQTAENIDRILDLETLIEAKEDAGRPKDLAVLPILRQTLAERRRTRDN